MSKDEFTQLTAKQFALYDDLNGSDKVLHYRYRTKSGVIQETGNGISVSHRDTNDVPTINRAIKHHNETKETIGKTLEEISVNGHKYNDYMKPKND